MSAGTSAQDTSTATALAAANLSFGHNAEEFERLVVRDMLKMNDFPTSLPAVISTVDYNENVVFPANHDTWLPATFLKDCFIQVNAKTKGVMIRFEVSKPTRLHFLIIHGEDANRMNGVVTFKAAGEDVIGWCGTRIHSIYFHVGPKSERVAILNVSTYYDPRDPPDVPKTSKPQERKGGEVKTPVSNNKSAYMGTTTSVNTQSGGSGIHRASACAPWTPSNDSKHTKEIYPETKKPGENASMDIPLTMFSGNRASHVSRSERQEPPSRVLSETNSCVSTFDARWVNGALVPFPMAPTAFTGPAAPVHNPFTATGPAHNPAPTAPLRFQGPRGFRRPDGPEVFPGFQGFQDFTAPQIYRDPRKSRPDVPTPPNPASLDSAPTNPTTAPVPNSAPVATATATAPVQTPPNAASAPTPSNAASALATATAAPNPTITAPDPKALANLASASTFFANTNSNENANNAESVNSKVNANAFKITKQIEDLIKVQQLMKVELDSAMAKIQEIKTQQELAHLRDQLNTAHARIHEMESHFPVYPSFSTSNMTKAITILDPPITIGTGSGAGVTGVTGAGVTVAGAGVTGAGAETVPTAKSL